VTGSETGSAPSPDEVKQVKKVAKIPVFIGSGCIVGSYFKYDGKWYNEIDPSRVKNFMKIIDEFRRNS